MCKEGTHLCSDVPIPTLSAVSGKGVNSEAWSVNTKISPALSNLIFMVSSSLFVTTISSSFFFQLTDVDVVESLVVQLTYVCKEGKLIVSQQMSCCWSDQPH